MATAASITIVPANEASWPDIQAIFGVRGSSAVCWCQRYKLKPKEAFGKVPARDRAARLREQTHCGDPTSPTTSGLIGFLDGEPVGWCAVEPRPAYFGLVRVFRVPWEGRSEDKSDASVWSVTCILLRAGFRRKRISYDLVRSAVGFARDRGARALEGYPRITQPGQDVTWDEIHVGSRAMFAAAGFSEVNHPTPRRVVMRIDFEANHATSAEATRH
jgi:GNAT superfamily N-acetyltransferase